MSSIGVTWPVRNISHPAWAIITPLSMQNLKEWVMTAMLSLQLPHPSYGSEKNFFWKMERKQWNNRGYLEIALIFWPVFWLWKQKYKNLLLKNFSINKIANFRKVSVKHCSRKKPCQTLTLYVMGISKLKKFKNRGTKIKFWAGLIEGRLPVT